MYTLFKILQGLAATLGVAFVLVMASPFLPISDAIQLFTVRSGSMEPTIPTGGLIFVRPSSAYAEGDIITVRTGDEKTVTHRVVEIISTDVGPAYRTKGDNNEEADPVEIKSADVIGKTILTLPYLGYPVTYAQTRTGFLTLIFIPALLIILSELITILQEVRRIFRKKHSMRLEKERHHVIAKNIVFSQSVSPVQEQPVWPRPSPTVAPSRRKIV
jgi:signal peptidase